MEETNQLLKQYLKKEFTTLIANQFLEEWIDAHATFNSSPPGYYILQKLKEFVNA